MSKRTGVKQFTPVLFMVRLLSLSDEMDLKNQVFMRAANKYV